MNAAKVKFGELLAYPLRSGVTVSKDHRGIGIRMINMGELFRYPRLGDVDMALVDIDYTNSDRFLVQPGDLLFARRSLTLEGAGKCAIVDTVPVATTWESSIIRARLARERANPHFYFYLFRSAVGRQLMESIVEQVAVAGVRISDLRDLMVPNPLLRDQDAVVDVLGALDEKIVVNKRMATAVEALLRNMYLKHGGDGKTCIGDISYSVRESVKPDSLSGNEPYVGLEHMPRKQVWIESWGRSSEVGSVKSTFESGDILFGKLRPYFHKVGMAQVDGVCSTDIIVVRANENKYRSWLLMALSSDEVVAYATARSDGTRMPRAKWSDLASFEVPWPGAEQVMRFEESAAPLIERAERGAAESRSLATLRDTLLPQLISGKLRIRDAEKIVEDAV
ncbi:restriction endonuclease subunit S [Streptomyces niveus]|uniref:restriction endonuclease subunit S n=1 Tax=Streptomyces niveus TaxID=193462 RepID=UPI003690DC35